MQVQLAALQQRVQWPVLQIVISCSSKKDIECHVMSIVVGTRDAVQPCIYQLFRLSLMMREGCRLQEGILA